jgi:hypothetical protein
MDFSLFSSCFFKFVNVINILRFFWRFSYQRPNRQRWAAYGFFPVAQSISGVRKLYKKIRQINRLLWSGCLIHMPRSAAAPDLSTGSGMAVGPRRRAGVEICSDPTPGASMTPALR